MTKTDQILEIVRSDFVKTGPDVSQGILIIGALYDSHWVFLVEQIIVDQLEIFDFQIEEFMVVGLVLEGEAHDDRPAYKSGTGDVVHEFVYWELIRLPQGKAIGRGRCGFRPSWLVKNK